MNLAYSETGSGPPLLILHGLFGAGRNWATIARRLGEKHQVISVDLRNHGNSPWADSMSYPEMAEDVSRLVEDLGFGAPVIMGHSMGGKVAMQLVLSRPEVASALIVVDAAPVTYPRVHDGAIAAMRKFDLSPPVRRGDVDRGLAEAIPDPAVRGFLLSNLISDGEGLRWRLNLAAIESSLETISGFPEIGSAWKGATLFLTGAESDYVRTEYRDAIAAMFPAVRYAPIAGAGHWVHADRPDEFVSEVIGFLASLPR